eukprot:CAMPEP_0203946954 /NCGR_PEP_ID=MMETSP0359-20131031/82052_1 /ASSEMBLY_ACC=CAM_ASM_000338 /TAXON_ID=268821 /ORGANISM="Scrippsiella Hangoei, Strain SHTV-5" /LENGTH=60 /DNA_ID=CAMNT_0050878315 /DNA_START=33 /DNA_END=211 /DNA_ORIENTATION=+
MNVACAACLAGQLAAARMCKGEVVWVRCKNIGFDALGGCLVGPRASTETALEQVGLALLQ